MIAVLAASEQEHCEQDRREHNCGMGQTQTDHRLIE